MLIVIVLKHTFTMMGQKYFNGVVPGKEKKQSSNNYTSCEVRLSWSRV